MTEYILCPIHAHTEGSLFSFLSDSQAFTCAIPLSSSVRAGQQQSAKETMSLDFYRNSGIYGVCSSEGFSFRDPSVSRAADSRTFSDPLAPFKCP